MDKIKRYLDVIIPTETCNLRCHYCYIAQKRKFNNKLASFSQSKETIRKALSKERLGGTCLLSMCAGGETLLSEEVLPIAYELLDEGHYVMLVTNGTVTKRFEEMAAWPQEIRNHLVIKFSFHYLEMKRLNMLERFSNNVNLMKKSGISFTVEVTPSDELIPYIDEIKEFCMENFGALCHVTIARDDRTAGIDHLSDYSFEEYKKIWGQFDSELFQFKTELYKVKRKEFCYAGEWSAYLNLESGELYQCYCGGRLCNIYENIQEPISFEPIGCKCEFAYCYNGHAFLALGDIPQLQSPAYAEVRNRVCTDGSEWLTPAVKTFMSSKLCESNKVWSSGQKASRYLKKKAIDLRERLYWAKCRLLKEI